MDSKRIIRLLEDQLSLASEREKEYLVQFKEQAGLIEKLSNQVESLTKTIQSLEKALLEKEDSIEVLETKNRTQGKLLQNKSEKREYQKQDSLCYVTKPTFTPKDRGNNGARRKEHFNLKTIIEEVEPSVEGFDKEKALYIGSVESIRYKYIPPQFIKHIYRLKGYQWKDTVARAKAPAAPIFNSNYDASFIAGLLQLRYIYSLPVERIVKFFTESGFELNKSTAHSLIKGAGSLLDNMGRALRETILKDSYLSIDETYHSVLEKGKNKEGKAICKGYLWAALSREKKLIQYFYNSGSRGRSVLTDYIGGYKGTIQSDGLAAYKILETDSYPHIQRLGCLQHAKRKFLDIQDSPRAREIIELINKLYLIEHSLEKDAPAQERLKRRQKEAPPILKEIKKKLEATLQDPSNTPKSYLYKAARYMLDQYQALTAYINDGRYKPDNNDLERCMRYISLSRRNSLFAGSHKGAERSALIYSLSVSCRLNNINSFEYFNDILTRLPLIKPNAPINTFIQLLPGSWNKEIHTK